MSRNPYIRHIDNHLDENPELKTNHIILACPICPTFNFMELDSNFTSQFIEYDRLLCPDCFDEKYSEYGPDGSLGHAHNPISVHSDDTSFSEEDMTGPTEVIEISDDEMEG
jgi:hypothetical protein